MAFDSDMSIKAIEKTLEIIEKQTLKQIIRNVEYGTMKKNRFRNTSRDNN